MRRIAVCSAYVSTTTFKVASLCWCTSTTSSSFSDSKRVPTPMHATFHAGDVDAPRGAVDPADLNVDSVLGSITSVKSNYTYSDNHTPNHTGRVILPPTLAHVSTAPESASGRCGSSGATRGASEASILLEGARPQLHSSCLHHPIGCRSGVSSPSRALCRQHRKDRRGRPMANPRPAHACMHACMGSLT